ncbi:MAG: hypothetical protein GX591_20485 [Planctomycetes bacterium]|nr:hypothetical protein [Planctomycetota bacterium]
MKTMAVLGLAGLLLAGCPGTGGTSGNPFVTITEYGLIQPSDGTVTQAGRSGVGAAVAPVFRREMAITFANTNRGGDLNTNFIAWVYPSSIRSAAQQDALFDSGYRQLATELRLGSAFVLPLGTFIYGGEGTVGATRIFLRAPRGAAQEGEDAPAVATERTISLLTPDVILVCLDPPESCESVAFEYLDEGDVITGDPISGALGVFGGASTTGGFKTLAQVSAYQCWPFQPGLFLKSGGGARAVNQFFEGEDVTFTFNGAANDDGDFAVVTLTSEFAVEEEATEEQP